MAGLLSDVLPFVYSRADALKRRVGGLLSDPVGTLTQAVNDANDRAGGLLSQTRAAAGEGLNYGPATQSLAQSIAAAYNPMGITVYHGSPHKFTKFDSSKIGTGEGAQAYGHGLYFAESPKVAEGYKNALSGVNSLTAGNRSLNKQSISSKLAKAFGNDGSSFTRNGRSIDEMARKLAISKQDLPDGSTAFVFKDGSHYIEGSGGGWWDVADGSWQPQGSLYKVDLPDSAVARMLDWDKPLSQQPQNVRDSLDALRQANPQGYQRLVDAQLGGPLMEQAAGMDLYRNLIKGANERQMVEVMRQQGIPGIRYLDGGSRGLGGGTSNFVVFPGEESLLTILERNGAPVR